MPAPSVGSLDEGLVLGSFDQNVWKNETRAHLRGLVPAVFKIPDLDHADVITHFELNANGRMMASVSTDKVITIWERGSALDQWKKTTSFKSHSGAVWKVRFAHPLMGRVLATCSLDKHVHVFDEAPSNPERLGETLWKRRSVIPYCDGPVMDIQFAPHHVGMMLAACSSFGRVIVCEAPDRMNLTYWTVIYELDVHKFSRLSSLSWNTARYNEHPILVVGSNDQNMPKDKRLLVLEINPNVQSVIQFKLRRKHPVSCVAFAPSISCAYSRLAVASKSNISIYVFLFHKPKKAEKYLLTEKPELLTEISDEDRRIVSLSWNSSGSCLSAQYDDGSIRIFKQSYSNTWSRMAIIQPFAAEEEKLDENAD